MSHNCMTSYSVDGVLSTWVYFRQSGEVEYSYHGIHMLYLKHPLCMRWYLCPGSVDLLCV